jgi:hypothetical protein
MKDLTRSTVTTQHPSLSKEEMVELYNAGTEIYGFIGGVEVDTNILQEKVPSAFTGSSYTDEEGVDHSYTWMQYARTFDSLTENKSIIQIGRCDANGNYANPISAAEFRTWADHWRIDNILTKSEMTALIPVFDI